MNPFLRPATPFGAIAKPTPDGWSHRSIGTWRGRAVELVYDPSAHDVAFIAGTPSPSVLAAMANAGWHRCGQDGRKQWWLRDRVDSAKRRLDRLTYAPTGAALSR